MTAIMRAVLSQLRGIKSRLPSDQFRFPLPYGAFCKKRARQTVRARLALPYALAKGGKFQRECPNPGVFIVFSPAGGGGKPGINPPVDTPNFKKALDLGTVLRFRIGTSYLENKKVNDYGDRFPALKN